jgi:hypothetical protein
MPPVTLKSKSNHKLGTGNVEICIIKISKFDLCDLDSIMTPKNNSDDKYMLCKVSKDFTQRNLSYHLETKLWNDAQTDTQTDGWTE